MEMSIAKALKHKNRIAQRIHTISDDIRENNSILAVNEREVDIKALEKMRRELVDHLVAVKTAIHQASNPVRSDIFQLSELKETIKFYRSLETTHGKRQSNRFVASDEYIEYQAMFRKKDVDEIVLALEARIDDIQEKLDSFNLSTKVDIEVPDSMNRPLAHI